MEQYTSANVVILDFVDVDVVVVIIVVRVVIIL